MTKRTQKKKTKKKKQWPENLKTLEIRDAILNLSIKCFDMEDSIEILQDELKRRGLKPSP